MSFWIFIALLLVLAIVIVIVAMRHNVVTETDTNDRIARNVNLYRQRLQALQKDFEREFIDKDSFDSLSQELSRQLLSDVDVLQTSSPRRSIGAVVYFAVLFPLFSLLMYQAIGAYPDWLISQELKSMQLIKDSNQFNDKAESIQGQILARVEERPDNSDYRMLLASFAMQNKAYEQAAVHYGVLAELFPGDAQALALFAQAEFLREGRKITATVARAMDEALRIDPFQKTVLGIQGIVAFEEGDYQSAIDHWQRLLSSLNPADPQIDFIQRGIAQAKIKLGVAPAKPAEDDQNLPSVSVSVSLAENVPKLSPSLSVFIYAKAASGPPMPLAVQKVPLAHLPITIKLNDAMAMMPQMKLSSFDEVILGARISKSGQPVPENGDWQVESKPLQWRHAGNVELKIHQQVQK